MTDETECPQYAAYAVVGSWSNMLATGLCGGLIAALAPYEWGRRILLQYPEVFSYGVFSHAGPSLQQLQETTFSMHFDMSGIAKAEEGSTTSTSLSERVSMKACVTGPEPGYVATPIIFTVLARTLLEEYCVDGIMPKGGVFTPAAAFRNSPTVFKSLQNAQIEFTLVE